MERLVEWLTEGRLRLRIGQVYALRDAAEAHRDLASREPSNQPLHCLPQQGLTLDHHADGQSMHRVGVRWQ